jgi:Zn-dependent M28 family amino/carboxypeptidase
MTKTLLAVAILVAGVSLDAAPQQTTEALQREVLGALTGATEIRPGVKIANRGELANRKEARDYLLATLKRLGLDGKRHPYGTAEGENIYAVVSCGKPNAETVIFGAHYDSTSRGPGANDDGTGVVTVMAMAAQLAKNKPVSRDVMFVFFDEEERGLIGSKAFAQWMKSENRNIHSVHTVDQVGWDEDKDRAIEIELPYVGAEAFYREAAKAAGLTMDIYVTQETGSDHNAFRQAGFKAIGITEEYQHQDTTPFIHKATDTFETVNFEYLGVATKLMIQVMSALTK